MDKWGINTELFAQIPQMLQVVLVEYSQLIRGSFDMANKSSRLQGISFASLNCSFSRLKFNSYYYKSEN